MVRKEEKDKIEAYDAKEIAVSIINHELNKKIN